MNNECLFVFDSKEIAVIDSFDANQNGFDSQMKRSLYVCTKPQNNDANSYDSTNVMTVQTTKSSDEHLFTIVIEEYTYATFAPTIANSIQFNLIRDKFANMTPSRTNVHIKMYNEQ